MIYFLNIQPVFIIQTAKEPEQTMNVQLKLNRNTSMEPGQRIKTGDTQKKDQT